MKRAARRRRFRHMSRADRVAPKLSRRGGLRTAVRGASATTSVLVQTLTKAHAPALMEPLHKRGVSRAGKSGQQQPAGGVEGASQAPAGRIESDLEQLGIRVHESGHGPASPAIRVGGGFEPANDAAAAAWAPSARWLDRPWYES